jgi:hypothetical protein
LLLNVAILDIRWRNRAKRLDAVFQCLINLPEIALTSTSVTLEDLADLRWKCGTGEEWHTGPCLDFSYDSPYYWSQEHETASDRAKLLPSWSKNRRKTFSDEDYCAINDDDFFVRGIIIYQSLVLRRLFAGASGARSAERILKPY